MRALALAGAMLLAAPALAQDRNGLERADAPPLEPFKIILVGDSTMAPHSGWASAFCANHVKSSVACLNLGRGGRSTRSYRAEGAWDIALGEARVAGYRATYVLIQFGHNDQSTRPERWTEMRTEFPGNLRRFVTEMRAAGAVPVLLTPLTRREFRAGRLANTLEPWAAEIRAVAAAMDVPLIDLNAESAAAVQRMGAETATQLAQVPPRPEELEAARSGTTLPPRPAPAAPVEQRTPPPGPRGRVMRKFDYTHVGPVGAELFARMIAQSLARAVSALGGQIVP
ncbi:rhamnogalacturonan acetylesterase [Sphingosinicella sp. LHD-64]|uniref:rhamnogalacturonan acetylesterase n=1 Tax=Sphingosinicella sp. LHD-64 TaxID=3072139 RepID=UPI00280F951E|nr:rhamnogalacturonan acetylesterase [Sphingosinicella sp. LHD-64]MDQ8756799.1 rhamnogalacturonan acetylesterase [Sphingosinicella sp. LHD-64]